MRGDDQQQNHVFSYLSPEMRVRKDHPLRAIRVMVDEILTQLSRRFDRMYARVGRPSIAPEKLLRAQLLQMLYSIRSERLLMEEMDYNLLFHWFVGLNADEDVWDATVFTKNRDRLLEADVAKEFLARVVAQARAKGLTPDEHFTVDGTLLEAWASAKSFQPKERSDGQKFTFRARSFDVFRLSPPSSNSKARIFRSLRTYLVQPIAKKPDHVGLFGNKPTQDPRPRPHEKPVTQSRKIRDLPPRLLPRVASTPPAQGPYFKD